MPQTLLLSFPMALLWMIIARQFSVFGFAIGYFFGFGVLLVIRINTSYEEDDQPIHLTRLPSQLLALVIYVYQLAKDVFFSGLDVASRIIRRDISAYIEPEIQKVRTQDTSNNQLISALSAHSITITPGELVVDFEEDEDGQTVMLVHSLDKKQSNMEKLNTDQTKRLKLIRQMLGFDAVNGEIEDDV